MKNSLGKNEMGLSFRTPAGKVLLLLEELLLLLVDDEVLLLLLALLMIYFSKSSKRSKCVIAIMPKKSNAI